MIKAPAHHSLTWRAVLLSLTALLAPVTAGAQSYPLPAT